MERKRIVCVLSREAASADYQKKTQDELYAFLEKVKIDFSNFANKIQLLEDVGIGVTTEDVKAWAWQLWSSQAPPQLVAVLKHPPKEGQLFARDSISFIEGLGVKFQALRSGLCVTRHFPAVCAKCYFHQACRLKK